MFQVYASSWWVSSVRYQTYCIIGTATVYVLEEISSWKGCKPHASKQYFCYSRYIGKYTLLHTNFFYLIRIKVSHGHVECIWKQNHCRQSTGGGTQIICHIMQALAHSQWRSFSRNIGRSPWLLFSFIIERIRFQYQSIHNNFFYLFLKKGSLHIPRVTEFRLTLWDYGLFTLQVQKN